jgi:hypothetical protein
VQSQADKYNSAISGDSGGLLRASVPLLNPHLVFQGLRLQAQMDVFPTVEHQLPTTQQDHLNSSGLVTLSLGILNVITGLTTDATQLSGGSSGYTPIHFAFDAVTSNFAVDVSAVSD